MPQGGTISIETANVDDGPWDKTGSGDNVPHVLIAIRDNGIGMDRETAAKAFDPFFTTKGIGRGTGLGLSQVHGFVQQSGGQVLIDSQPGAGTTVRIYLPRLADGGQEDELTSGVVEADPQRGAETILVVEDDDAVRAFSTDVLRELGYRVLEAPNAGAALEILDRQQDVRLLFTDIGLPNAMNGRQLSDEARRRRHGLKVLLTTGYANDTIVHEGRLEPGVALISKPFSIADLTTNVRQVLET